MSLVFAPSPSSRPRLWPAVAALAAGLALFEFTGLDLTVQDRLYDFAANRWLVDGNEPVGRLVFYNAPKIGVIATGVALLVLALGPETWRARLRADRRGLVIAVLTLAALPALAGLGKNFTNVHCPSEVRRYGGSAPYVKLCSPYPEDDRPAAKGRCFPAGHASGGFALMGLAWLRASPRWRRGMIALGLAAGWWMGAYQMAKGAHYLSHTVTTMLLAWLVAALWARALWRRL
jgi:membrane-associated PAP2 superfamily phosphatase